MIGADRQFRIDTYNSKKDSRPKSLSSLALEEFYALFQHEEVDCVLEDGKTPGCLGGQKCLSKDGLAWTPGFIDDACRCGSTKLPDKKKRERSGHCPECGKKIRFAANVTGLDAAVFDLDHLSEQQVNELCPPLDGLELYLHTSHNHLPPDNQNFRLILPLARTITPDEWKQLRPAIIRKFKLPDTDAKHGVDRTTKDPARLAFFPRAFRGRAFVNVRQEGELLNPDSLLIENVRHSREVSAAPKVPGQQPESGSYDIAELRSRFRGYDPDEDFDGSKKEIVRRIVSGEALAEAGARGSTTLRAGTIVGWRMPIGLPVEVALEILRPSISKIELLENDDPDENSIEAWMNQATRGYEKGQSEQEARAIDAGGTSGMILAVIKRKREEAALQATPLPRAFGGFTSSASVYAPPAASTGQIPAPVPSISTHFPVPPAGVEDRDDEGEWRRNGKLITLVDKQGLLHSKNTFSNVVTVLENHRAWKGALKYNELTNEPEAHGGPLPEIKRDPDRLIIATRIWMMQKEELDFPRGEIADAVEFVAREESYDPPREYLLGLKHDGERRSNTWLIDYCGARLEDDSGLDVTEYVKMVGEKWLMAAAARALYPGCQADNVLVLEGPQFAGKSSALKILGGEWFAVATSSLGDLTSQEVTAKSWIIEMAELSTMKKGETEKQKAFFSNRVDDFRFSYARRAGKYKRRCVFGGSTNEKQYLLDPTGNRRFWCVWCVEFDLPKLRRDRDQLWAEVVAKVRAGETCPNCSSIEERCPEHRWWLDKKQTAFAEVVSKTRLKSEFSDEIRAWWFSRENKPQYLMMKTILVDILGLTIDKKELYMQAIGRAMVSLGFERKHVPVPGGQAWAYVPAPLGPLVFAPPPPQRKPMTEDQRADAMVKIAEATAPKDKQ